MPRRQALPALLCLLCCAAARTAWARETGRVNELSTTCKQQYDALFATYYSQPVIAADRYNCSQILHSALENTDVSLCPADDDMRACFAIGYDAWLGYLQQCELFTAPPNCPNANSAFDSSCQRPIPHGSWSFATAASYFVPSVFQYDTGIVPNAGVDWRTVQAEGESRRRSRRHILSTEHARMLMAAEGEAGGVTGEGVGCLPDFFSVEDFQFWLNGAYQEPVYGRGNVQPIAVIFWVLHGLGILVLATK